MMYAVSLIPLALVIYLLVVRKQKSYKAMLAGALLGYGINCMFHEELGIELISLDTCFENVVIGNMSIIVSIYLLGLFMYLLTETRILKNAGAWIVGHVHSSRIMFVLAPVLAGLLSEDDYLAVMSAGSISSSLAKKMNLSKKNILNIAVMVNLVAVAICAISPFASWSPVITGAISMANLPVDYKYSSIPYNLTVIMLLLAVAMVMLKEGHIGLPAKKAENDTRRSVSDHSWKGIVVLVLGIASLVLSYLFFEYMTTVASPLICASVVSIIVTIISGTMTKQVSKKRIIRAFNKTWGEMSDLTRSIISIWTFSYVFQALGFNNLIVSMYSHLNIADVYIPVFLFCIAAVFSFLTGSAYGAFNLFMPLAAELTLSFSPEMRLLSVAAAIGGSLFSLFSYSSDIINLSNSATEVSVEELRNRQFSIGRWVFLFAGIGYVALAYGTMGGYSILAYGLVMAGFVVTMFVQEYGLRNMAKKHMPVSDEMGLNPENLMTMAIDNETTEEGMKYDESQRKHYIGVRQWSRQNSMKGYAKRFWMWIQQKRRHKRKIMDQ